MINALIFLLAIPLALNGGPFSATVKLSTPTLSLYDPLVITVDLAYPEEYSVDFNTLRSSLLKNSSLEPAPFSLVEEDISPDKKTVSFTLEPLIAGEQILSFYTIAFVKKGTDAKVIHPLLTAPFTVKVTMPESEAPLALSPPPLVSLNTPFPVDITLYNRAKYLRGEEEFTNNTTIFQSHKLPWLQLCSLIALSFMFWYLKQLKEKPVILTQEQRQRQAKKKALIALEELNTEDLSSQERFQSYYTKLSQTVREFIEEKYDLPAQTATTPELISSLSTHPEVDQDSYLFLSDLFTSLDATRFSCHTNSSTACYEAQKLVWSYIQSINS